MPSFAQKLEFYKMKPAELRLFSWLLSETTQCHANVHEKAKNMQRNMALAIIIFFRTIIFHLVSTFIRTLQPLFPLAHSKMLPSCQTAHIFHDHD